MSYGNGIKLTAGFDVGAKTPLDSKSVVQTIAERDAFVTDNLVYEGLEVYVKDTGHKYRYNGTSWIDLDTQSGSESGTGEGLTTEQANQLTTAYEHSQTPHVSADDIPTNISDLTNDSGFITSSDLPTVPTKVSDLENDRGYLTSIPEEYITETELETKGYLTEHQSLTDYAKKTDIPNVSDFLTEVPAEYVTDTKLSTELDKKVNKEAGKGLSTNDLTNELVIKINSSATEAFVTNAIANAQLSGGEVDLSGYAKTSDIPTKTSDLNNDSGFIGYPDVIVIDKGSMDAEVDLDNDIPLGRNTILLTGRVVYNTYGHELVFVYRDRESSDSFTIYTMKGDKVVVSKSNGNWNITSSTSFIYRDNANSLYQKITDKTLTTTAKTIPTAINELKSGLNGIKVPTKTSELTNNSGFITTIPDEYITETELNAKGYLTSHQDISNLQTKTDNNLTTTSKEVVGAINEVKDKADLILDTEVHLNKTYSSSKICSDIQDAIDSSKSFTLAEIGKMSGASYKVVTSTTEMTDEKIIYLLENGATYDMYIVETAGTTTKIGDTAIDLSSYLKITDAESAYLKKTEATLTYATQTSFDNHVTDTVAHLTQFEKNKLLTTDNITSTINSSSDSIQVPSAKAVYDELTTAVGKKANTSDIPTKVSELTNDSNYQTAKQVNSAVTTEIAKVETELKGNIKELSSNLGELEENVKFDSDDLNTLYVPNKTITVRTNRNTKNLPQSVMVNFLVTSFAYIEGQYYRITQYCYENSENLSCAMYVRRGTSNAGESSITWSDWTELATMDKVVPSDNYSTITKSIKLTRRTKTYIFKDVNTSETKRYFELNVNGNVSHSGDVFFRKYVGLLYLYPWTGASRGLYLEQVQHIGMTVDSIQIDIAYGWDENGVYIQNNGALNLPIDIVAPSSWFVN